MTEIFYEHGNILKTKAPVIVNQANAQGRYQSGVAAAIREAYPRAYTAYKAHEELNGLRLGDIVVCDTSPHKIIHTVSQEFYGNSAETGERYTDYGALAASLASVNQYLVKNNIEEVAFPLLGCGLAGGSWSIVSKLIEEKITHAQIFVYVFDGIVPEHTRIEISRLEGDAIPENFRMDLTNLYRDNQDGIMVGWIPN